MFVNLKNSSMFAVPYKVKSGFTASNSGFLISDCEHTGYNTPVYHCNGDTALDECKATGKVISFFYFQIFKHFYSVMPYTESNVLAKNNSIRKNTPSGAKTMPIGFKTNRQVTDFSPSPAEYIQENNNCYLQAVLKAFTDFIKDESTTTLDNNYCNVAKLKSKLEAAQLLFPEDRKNFEYTLKF